MPDSPDPFAEAGYGPSSTEQQPKPRGTDPFAEAGYAPPPPPSSPSSDSSAPRNFGIAIPGFPMPVYTDPAYQKQFNEGAGRAAEKVGEGATFGMLPYVAAGARALTGTPFSRGLQEARDFTASTSKSEPALATIAEGVGSILPTSSAVRLAAPAVRAVAGAVPYMGSSFAQALLGGTIGGANAAGHDIGSGQTDNLLPDVAKATGTGAAIGGVAPFVGRAFQAIPNVISSGVQSVRNIFSGPGRDAVAGNVLREAGGDFVNDTATSPLIGMPLRTVQSTGNPGLAGLERTLASTPGAQATTPGNLVINGRTPNQADALVRALVGGGAGQEPAILTNQASARGVQAIQNSREVLRQAESDLWRAPELNGVRLRAAPLIAGVNNDIAGMAPSFRMATAQGPLAGLVADIHAIPEGASIADVNAVRSRVLEQARASRAAGDAVTGSAAQQLADSLLDRTGAALGTAGAPIQDAYATARDFTRQRAQAFGYPDFDAVLRPNTAGNMRANPETAFGHFFDMNGGTGAGLQRLQGVSNLLRATGQPEAIQAADRLDGAAESYLRAGILRQARAGSGLDPLQNPAINTATLAATANRMAPAITGTPMIAHTAGDIQNVGRAAELFNRPSTLRGDANSTTFEKLRNNDLVSAILGQAGSSSLGAVAGGYTGAKYGPEEVPWYLRVPGGALAGALLGQRMGPYIGRVAAHIPGASMAITGPTQDIMRRVSTALENPQEYQRLLAAQMPPPTALMAPGGVSGAAPRLAAAAVPMITGGGAR